MKLPALVLWPALAGFLAVASHGLAANPDVGAAIVKQFGESQVRNIVLIVSQADDDEPEVWKVYARDPYRPGELVCSVATKDDGKWRASPESAGRLLKRVPKATLDFKRLKIDAKEARGIIIRAAGQAGTEWETMSFQLVANETTGVPEWGIALQDDTGFEVGFCVVSGETGVMLSEDWTPRFGEGSSRMADSAEKEGAAAAKRVKQGVRKAWNWTENAGKKTGGFFKELFK